MKLLLRIYPSGSYIPRITTQHMQWCLCSPWTRDNARVRVTWWRYSLDCILGRPFPSSGTRLMILDCTGHAIRVVYPKKVKGSGAVWNG